MINFMNVIGTYDERKIDKFEEGDLIIDTCLVTDSEKPYETAISHPKFNNGKWVIVELYDTKEEAKKGHNKWVKIMTSKEFPKELNDVSSAKIAQVFDSVSSENWRTKPIMKD